MRSLNDFFLSQKVLDWGSSGNPGTARFSIPEDCELIGAYIGVRGAVDVATDVDTLIGLVDQGSTIVIPTTAVIDTAPFYTLPSKVNLSEGDMLNMVSGGEMTGSPEGSITIVLRR